MNISRKKLLLGGIILAILLVLPVTIFLTQQQQDVRQRASEGNQVTTSQPVPCLQFGDLNNDTLVTEADKLLIMRYLAGSESFTDGQKKNADVNGDGAINMSDALQVTQYYSNVTPTFPVCVIAVSACLPYGDIDKNGKIDYTDITYIFSMSKNLNKSGNTPFTDEERKYADLDGNNAVTLEDVNLAKNFTAISDRITTFPNCPVTVGPNNPSTVEQVITTDTQNKSWSNLDGIKASDDNKATVTTQSVTGSQMISNSLIAKGFGFALPSEANIKGILVEIERRTTSSPGSQTYKLNLTKDGTKNPVGTTIESGTWPMAESYLAVGGPENLWGTTFTPAEINSPNFGVVLAVKGATGLSTSTAQVDHIRITVTYNTVGQNTTPTNPTPTATPSTLTPTATPPKDITPTITVQTTAASNISSTAATLNGTVSRSGNNPVPGGMLTANFLYSTQDIACSDMTSSAAISNLNTQANPTPLTYTLTGLTPNTQYYFCAKASTATNNAYYGSKMSFTTLGTSNPNQCGLTTGRPNDCSCQQPSQCASNFCNSSAKCAAPPTTIVCEYRFRGDFDCDGWIGLSDLTKYSDEKAGTLPTKDSDISGDGVVSVIDLAAWVESYLSEFRKKP